MTKTKKHNKRAKYSLLKAKKAQVKMFETISVLVVFFFLLVFGMTFYFKIQESSIIKEKSKISQLLTIQIAQKTTFLPELDCVLVGVQKENCFDTIKLQSFSEIISTPQGNVDYFPVFEYSTLTVTEVFPGNATYVLYNRPAENAGYSMTQSPILLYDSIHDKYSFGVLEIKVYDA